MVIVTAAADGERSGCLVGFATPVSINPERYLACVSKANHTWHVAMAATHLAVHLAPSDDPALAELFGGRTGDEIDKLARCPWSEGPHGTVLLDACADRFVGAVLDRIDLGDHTGMLLSPVSVQRGEGAPPLRYRAARGIEPGHPA